jgi:hypothetical protein
LLGWASVDEHWDHVRQFRVKNGAITVDGIDTGTLIDDAGRCRRRSCRRRSRSGANA